MSVVALGTLILLFLVLLALAPGAKATHGVRLAPYGPLPVVVLGRTG
jgi:hypothetical protein